MKGLVSGSTLLKIVGVVVIGAVEVAALIQGIDGQLLATVLMVIAGIVGYEIKKK